MEPDSLARLEERLAWLQRHVAEQDKAMLRMAEDIDQLRRLVAELRGKLAGEPGETPGPEERPPHY